MPRSATIRFARYATLTDVNGDGRSDLVLYDPATGATTLAFSQANGGFTQQQIAGRPGLSILAQQGAP
jgi:hypothetical protein